jgi:hypothetical protein
MPADRGETNPFLATPRTEDIQQVTLRTEFRSEASILAANVLSSAGVTRFKIMSRDEIPADLDRYDAVWSADAAILGTITIVTLDVASTRDRIAAALIANASQVCKGRFASAREDVSPTGGIHLLIGCDYNAQTTQASYAIMPRTKGGYYVFAVFGDGNAREAARQIDGQLYNSAVNYFAKR